jgi:hypothetical protein
MFSGAAPHQAHCGALGFQAATCLLTVKIMKNSVDNGCVFHAIRLPGITSASRT